jgi:egghead protein (zeste-white 4 protein)
LSILLALGLIFVYLVASVSALGAFLLLITQGSASAVFHSPEGGLFDAIAAILTLILTAIALRYVYYYYCWWTSRDDFKLPRAVDIAALRQKPIPHLKFQVTTKGGSLPVVERTLTAIEGACAKYEWLRPHISAEVITEVESEVISLTRTFAGSPLEVTAVRLPPDYSTPKETRLKARALHYLVEKRRQGFNRRPGRTFIVHMDEETFVPEAQLLILVEYLAGNPAQLSQGPIFYPLEWNRSPWLCRALESTRPFGCSECAQVMEHPPPPHLHGSNLVVDEEVENEIGWDFGTVDGQAFVAEDLLFGLRAYAVLGREGFGWHGATMLEQPPLSIYWAVQRRLCWVQGTLQGLRVLWSSPDFAGIRKRDKARLHLSVGYRVATYSLGFPVGMLGLVFVFQPLGNVWNWWSPFGIWRMLLLLSGAGWVFSYQIGIVRNLRYQVLPRSERIKQRIMMLLLTPFAGLTETAGPFLALVRWLLGLRAARWTPTPKLAEEPQALVMPVEAATAPSLVDEQNARLQGDIYADNGINVRTRGLNWTARPHGAIGRAALSTAQGLGFLFRASFVRFPLAVGVGLALLLTSFNLLGFPLLKEEEGSAVTKAVELGSSGLHLHLLSANHSPVTLLALSGWLQLTDLVNSWTSFLQDLLAVQTARLLLVLVAVTVAALIYVLTLRLTGGRLQALAAALIFATSPFQLWFGRWVEPDVFAGLWLVAALAVALPSDSPRRSWLLRPFISGALLGIAILNKEVAILGLPALLVACLAWSGRSRRLKAMSLTAASTFAVLGSYVAATALGGHGTLSDSASLAGSLVWPVTGPGDGGLLNPSSSFYSVVGSWLGMQPVLIIVGAASSVFLLAFAQDWRKRAVGLLGCGFWLWFAFGGVNQVYYVSSVLPVWCAAAVVAVGDAAQWLNRRRRTDRRPEIRFSGAKAVIVAILLLLPAAPVYGRIFATGDVSYQSAMASWMRSNIPGDAAIIDDGTDSVDLVRTGGLPGHPIPNSCSYWDTWCLKPGGPTYIVSTGELRFLAKTQPDKFGELYHRAEGGETVWSATLTDGGWLRVQRAAPKLKGARR